MIINATNHAGLRLIRVTLLAVVLAGCGDERLVQATREADRRQAQQNDQLARTVNEETVFRQDMTKLQRELRADQASISQQRDQLEVERKQIASQRAWAEFYAPLLESLGVVAVVVAALAYAGIMLHTLRNSGPADIVLVESLVDQLLSVEQLPAPMLLPPDNDTQLLTSTTAGQNPASTAIIPRRPDV